MRALVTPEKGSHVTYAPARGGDVSIGSGVTVHRPGLGAMRITGPGAWGEPPDRQAAIDVLRQAVELGVDFIDTADAYGPFVSEELIAAALYPYDGVTVGTKGGLVRTGPDAWHCLGRPEYLRQCVEMSLRRLRLDRIELYQLHRIDPRVPLIEQVGVLDDMRAEGKIHHIGLSEVTVAELAEARLIAPVASVQSSYSLLNRRSDKVLDYCMGKGLAFICSSPVDGGELARSPGPVAAIARQAGRTPAQVALAWLLHRSPALLPIPGTASVTHVRENVGVGKIELSAGQYAALAGLTGRDAAPGPA